MWKDGTVSALGALGAVERRCRKNEKKTGTTRIFSVFISKFVWLHVIIMPRIPLQLILYLAMDYIIFMSTRVPAQRQLAA